MLVHALSRRHVAPPPATPEKGIALPLTCESAAQKTSRHITDRDAGRKGRSMDAAASPPRPAGQDVRARTPKTEQLAAGRAPSSDTLDRCFQLPPVSAELAMASERAARALGSADWEDILRQVHCLEYISPDIEQCLMAHPQRGAEHELELTGHEFLGSPSIPTILLHTSRVPRRPGLRERPPRQSYLAQASRSVDEEDQTSRKPRGKMARRKRPTRLDQHFDIENQSPNRAPHFEEDSSAQLLMGTRDRLSLDTRDTRQWAAPLPQRSQTARKSKDCNVPGCTKGARSRGRCKRHGGGKRCTYPECGRSDQGGGFCIAHGGGKRCAHTGCSNSAQSRGLCKTHGGGKRCRVDNCMRSSQDRGLCRGHASLIEL